jgi:hypothetical protein
MQSYNAFFDQVGRVWALARCQSSDGGYRILGSLLPQFREFIEARGALADVS